MTSLAEYAAVEVGLPVISAKGTPGTVIEVTADKIVCSDGEGPAIKIEWAHGGKSHLNQNMLDAVTVALPING
jgi:hypothetical protein